MVVGTNGLDEGFDVVTHPVPFGAEPLRVDDRPHRRLVEPGEVGHLILIERGPPRCRRGDLPIIADLADLADLAEIAE